MSTDKNRTLWCMLPAIAALAVASQSARGQAAVQRTTTSNPSSLTAPNTVDAADNMLRQYRTMWQKMSTAQQKALLDSGGSTPEQFERTLRTKGLSAPSANAEPMMPPDRQSPAQPHTAADALDSLTTSLQDLNAIRDANLSRVQKDGCPPEVTSRLTDLKGKLRQAEAELNGVAAPLPASSQVARRVGAGDPTAIAADWYKQTLPDQPEAARAGGSSVNRPGETGGDNRENKLLSDVLPGGPTLAGPQRNMDPKSTEVLQRKKDSEEEIARIKAEIAQLSGACASLKR